jgi:hypothetical protein
LNETRASNGTQGSVFERLRLPGSPTRELASRLEGRMARAAREAFEGKATKLATVGVPPGAPRGTTSGRPGGQLATHATHRPVTEGAGNAFAMRRSGVRIPAAPPTNRDRPLRGSVPCSSPGPRGPTRSSTTEEPAPEQRLREGGPPPGARASGRGFVMVIPPSGQSTPLSSSIAWPVSLVQ